MRGLKLTFIRTNRAKKAVASFTDAWIETLVPLLKTTEKFVASFTDAWIETFNDSFNLFCAVSHLLQMRGLKLPGMVWECRYNKVASFTDAWIET